MLFLTAMMIALWLPMRAVLVRMLTSLKFWTTMFGIAATYLAKKGVILDPEMAQYVAGFFGLLLAGQAATDHGKAKAEIEAKRDIAYMSAPAVNGSLSENQKAMAESPKPEGGFTKVDLLFSILIVGLILFGATMTACSWVKGETKHVVSNVVDCSSMKAKEAITEFKPMATQFVLDSLDNTGKPDATRMETIASTLKAEIGGCVMDAAIKEILFLVDQGFGVGSPMSSPMAVDGQALEQSWAKVRQTQYGGKVFQ